MDLICSSTKCTGCGACVNICSQKCIKLVEKKGFYHPFIDEQKCISCNLCKKICPGNTKYLNKNQNLNPIVIAGYSKEKNFLQKSTSGGFFSIIAEYVINKNGIVFGAVMDSNLNVFHKKACNMEQIEKMRGSKYIQSDTKYTFQEVKKNLNDGKYVLYSGTPCQIAGLYKYLNNKDYNNLITIDLVCHGVGSKELFSKYIKYLENKYKNQIIEIRFRSKKRGYLKFTVEITFKSGKKVYIKSLNDIYMSMYYKKGIYRESCYSCEYAKIPRVGDFTIGDFLELDINSRIYKEAKNKGISLILINNKKGIEVFDKIKEKLEYEERTLNEAISSSYNLSNSTIMPKYRDSILSDEQDDIKKIQLKYCKRLKREYIADIIGSDSIRKIQRRLGLNK